MLRRTLQLLEPKAQQLGSTTAWLCHDILLSSHIRLVNNLSPLSLQYISSWRTQTKFTSLETKPWAISTMSCSVVRAKLPKETNNLMLVVNLIHLIFMNSPLFFMIAGYCRLHSARHVSTIMGRKHWYSIPNFWSLSCFCSPITFGWSKRCYDTKNDCIKLISCCRLLYFPWMYLQLPKRKNKQTKPSLQVLYQAMGHNSTRTTCSWEPNFWSNQRAKLVRWMERLLLLKSRHCLWFELMCSVENLQKKNLPFLHSWMLWLLWERSHCNWSSRQSSLIVVLFTLCNVNYIILLCSWKSDISILYIKRKKAYCNNPSFCHMYNLFFWQVAISI